VSVPKRRKKPTRKPSGPPPTVKPHLIELARLLVNLLPSLEEHCVQAALAKTFGTTEKGYGSIIALRNTLKFANQGQKD
jgi:hypothetical protein